MKIGCILIAVTSIMDGMLWAPCLNALLDFRGTEVVAGEMLVVEVPDAWPSSTTHRRRRLAVTFRGEALEARIDPKWFWNVGAVRGGGLAP
jgi:hypothetical protein